MATGPIARRSRRAVDILGWPSARSLGRLFNLRAVNELVMIRAHLRRDVNNVSPPPCGDFR